jgi:hypothetical protein
MRLLLFIGFLYVGMNFQAQSSKIDKITCLILVDIKYNGAVNLYSDKGKVIKQLKHNIKDEDYLLLKIISKNDSMYFVEANYAIAGFIAKGWVKKKNSVLGIYSRAYSSILNLYKHPGKTSEIQSTVKEYAPDFLPVKDCENNWLYIDIKIANKEYKGWMAPEMQCANAYSTCN